MGRIYYNTFENVSITNANGDHDLFYLGPADDKPVRLWELELYVISELGDAAEEWLRLEVIRGFTAASTGGTSVTLSAAPRQNLADADPACTMRYGDTAVATTGTSQVLWAGAMNVRAGLDKVWLPEVTPYCTQAQTSILVRLMAAVTDDVTMSGTLTFEELG